MVNSDPGTMLLYPRTIYSMCLGNILWLILTLQLTWALESEETAPLRDDPRSQHNAYPPYQFEFAVQPQQMSLPTLIPSENLFKPSFTVDMLAPSFPIVKNLLSSINDLPQEGNPYYAATAATRKANPTTTTPKPRISIQIQTEGPIFYSTAATTKSKAKMSKLSFRPIKNETSGAAAQVSVPSHRLLNDILVIPSSRRLYILAIIPVHESADNQGFECGRVDLNGFVRLAAFLDELNQVNSNRILKDVGLSLGAVIIDSCSSDLRTVADLFELLSGTNIQKSDVVAMVRDDSSYLPNLDQLARHLHLPIVNTFFSTGEQPLTTGTLPSISSVLEVMLGLLEHTNSTCVSLLHDEHHDVSARLLSEMGVAKGICIEQTVDLKHGSKSETQSALRRLLLTEARVVIVLLGEKNWIKLMKALRTELVIAGRFIFFSPQDARWTSSKQFLEQWPQFDQLLLTVTPEKPPEQSQLSQLAKKFAALPFPQHWLKQFWATAFQCHIDGESTPGEQFSKECSHRQMFNVSEITPDIDIAPISIAVTAIAHATRKLVDTICPGALIQRLSDCLNDPQDALFSTMQTLHFSHQLSHDPIHFNETTQYRDHTLIVNRVLFDAQLEYEPIASWSYLFGFNYTAGSELVMEERDGSRVPLRSTCPKSSCSAEVARREQAGDKPSLKDSLKSISVLVYTICAGLAFFVCLMCMYQRVICRTSDRYRVCTAYTFGGLALLCLVSVMFFMTPNPIACLSRRILFPLAIATIFGPITVKSICIWRTDLLTDRGEVRQAVGSHSVLTFWLCAATALVQLVVSIEWAMFEPAIEVTYVVSQRQGNAWRCAPGDDFEHRILWSCALSGIMIVVSLVCSTLTVRHIQSRQNILISVIAVIFAAVLYIALPLMTFRVRDICCAAVQLTLCFLIIVVSYCQRAFASDESESSNISLVPSSIRHSQQIHPYWVETTMTRPASQRQAAQVVYTEYHQTATLAQRSEKRGNDIHNTSITNGKVVAKQPPINERYDIPPISNNMYGQREYVSDNDTDEEQDARL